MLGLGSCVPVYISPGFVCFVYGTVEFTNCLLKHSALSLFVMAVL